MTAALRVLALTHAFPRWADDPVGLFVAQLALAVEREGVQTYVLAPSAPGLAARDTFRGLAVRRYRYAPTARETLAYTGTLSDQVRGSWAGRAAFVGMLASGVAAAVAEGRARDVHVIHAHWWLPGGLIGMVASRILGVPMITTSHGSDVRLATSPGAQRAFQWVAQASSAVTAVSSWLARAATERAGREVLVAPMPVFAEGFPPGPPQRPERLLFVGKLSEQKGLHHLLRALAMCRAKPTLEVVGAGRLDDSAVRALAAELGLADRIVWTPILSQPDLAVRYREAAALVIPAIDEGLGMTAIEAALSETPVIAFASGGLPDCVEDGRTGLLVPPGDVASLARAIDRVFDDEALARRWGRQGREFALGRFGADAVASLYAGLYRSAK